MKNIGKARNARINQASKHAYYLHQSLTELQGYTATEIIDEKEIWKKARQLITDLSQCFHEANAYNNALQEAKK